MEVGRVNKPTVGRKKSEEEGEMREGKSKIWVREEGKMCWESWKSGGKRRARSGGHSGRSVGIFFFISFSFEFLFLYFFHLLLLKLERKRIGV